MKVTVVNAENGGLQAVIAAHTDPQMVSTKSDITFKNTFDAVKKETTQTNKTVKTGDNSNLELMIGLFCISGCMLAIAIRKKYNRL